MKGKVLIEFIDSGMFSVGIAIARFVWGVKNNKNVKKVAREDTFLMNDFIMISLNELKFVRLIFSKIVFYNFMQKRLFLA